MRINSRGTVMKNLIATFALLISLISGFVLAGQRSDDLSPDAAKDRARGHASSLLGMQLDLSKATVRYQKAGKRRSAEWKVISERSEYWISVDAKTGAFRGFLNNARRHQQWKGVGRTSEVRFNTDAAWKAHLVALGKHFGLPQSATLSDFVRKRTGEVKDSNNSGYIGAKFRDSAGEVIAIINCDPQDGVLVMFTRED